MQKSTTLLLMIALVLFGCQSGSAPQEATVVEEDKAYVLTPFSSTYEFPEANLEEMNYQDGVFNFAFSGYELRQQTPDADQKMCANSGDGSHIHLIVDTAPYAAKYDATFDYEIADGSHYILSFLSRSYHESIKNGQAHIAQKVEVAQNSITAAETVEAPMLFYSRPKGTYVGAANTDKVMLDFFLLNVDLGEDYQVKAEINDETYLIDKWQPYYIEGLPMGENTITLTLIDANGEAVDTPLNPVTREFTLQADPIEEAQ